MTFNTFAKLAISFVTVNTYINACIHSSQITYCTMHKDGISAPGLNCYFAIAAWFVGASYIISKDA